MSKLVQRHLLEPKASDFQFFMKSLIKDSVFAILQLASQMAGPLQVEVCGFLALSGLPLSYP